MSCLQKIHDSGGKIPRKLKKQIKKMPVGVYCYGSAIGDKGRMINGKRKYATICCPHYHSIKNNKVGEEAYCSFLHKIGDFVFADQVKICRDYAGIFPAFKKYIKNA